MEGCELWAPPAFKKGRVILHSNLKPCACIIISQRKVMGCVSTSLKHNTKRKGERYSPFEPWNLKTSTPNYSVCIISSQWKGLWVVSASLRLGNTKRQRERYSPFQSETWKHSWYGLCSLLGCEPQLQSRPTQYELRVRICVVQTIILKISLIGVRADSGKTTNRRPATTHPAIES